MNSVLIAILVMVGCNLIFAGVVPAVKFLIKFSRKVAAVVSVATPEKEVAAVVAATPAVQAREPVVEVAASSAVNKVAAVVAAPPAVQVQEPAAEVAASSAVNKVAAVVAAPPAVQVQEPAVAAADGQAGFNVGFNANKKTFKETYEALSEEQKKFFDGLRDYALTKNGARLNESLLSISVTILNKPILRLKIRRRITIASFKIKSDVMRDFAYPAENGIKEKETEIRVTDGNLFAAACDMVDLMVKQHEQKRRERLNAKLI